MTGSKREDSQWSRRILQIRLDLLRQFQQVHDLRHASPRKALSGGDFCLGDFGVAIHFQSPETSLMVRMNERLFVVAQAVGGWDDTRQDAAGKWDWIDDVRNLAPAGNWDRKDQG